MTNTYIALSTITLATATSLVTFGSIPQTYRDLVLVVNGSFTAFSGLQMQVNADTGNNYFTLNVQNTASSSYTNTRWFVSPNGFQAAQPFTATVQLMDYSATDKHKSALVRLGTLEPSLPRVEASALRWGNTSAMTSFRIFGSDSTFAIGATFSLYGIRS